MPKFCTHCGSPLPEGAGFCVSCGKPVAESAKENTKAKEEKNSVTQERTNPEVTAEAKKKIKKESQDKQEGFFAMLLREMKDLLKHPKKLIPTIVLAVIWIVLPIIMGFVSGANIPIVRFISTLTYANGGIFGGFFGTVGGIFGKAVFAAIVNGMVLSLFAKKNPFAGLKKGFSGVLGGGVKAVSPFLIGGGIGFLLYFCFNITCAPQNCAIAVVCAVSALQTVASQNGLAFAAVFFAAKKLSKGKAPSKVYVNRVLSGLLAGFAVGFPLTFLRYPLLIAGLGLLLTAAGIGLPFLLSALEKKAAAKQAGTN